MKRRFLHVILILLTLVAAGPILSAATACAGCPQSYEVVLQAGGEQELPALSAMAGAAIVQEGSRLVVTTTPARARLLASDARVASVERAGKRIAAESTMTSWANGVSYAYDGAGNIRSIGSDTYLYDTAGRLVQGSAGASNTQSYTYDAFGNRTDANRTGVQCVNGQDCELALPVNWRTNRLGPRADITYDQAGNLTSYNNAHTYAFDAIGSMARQIETNTTREYVYTADDERLAVYDGVWHWSVRDLGGRVLREFTSTGQDGTTGWQWRRDHIYRGSLLLASVSQQYDAADLPVTGTTRLHYHLDHLGTPRLVTDDSGMMAGEHAYYPFGAEVGLASESPRESLHFTGHERDEIGSIASLDYMHARYYSAPMGRFLSVDPALGTAEQPQSWNRYAYVRSNPLNAVDPTGRRETGYKCDENGDNCEYETTQPAEEYTAVDTAADFVDTTLSQAVSPLLTWEAGVINDNPTQVAVGTAGLVVAGATGGGVGGSSLEASASGRVVTLLPDVAPELVYSARVEEKALVEPLMHNFPSLLDSIITSTGKIEVKQIHYVEYTLEGVINGRAGVYQIGGRPIMNNILGVTHRFFKPF